MNNQLMLSVFFFGMAMGSFTVLLVYNTLNWYYNRKQKKEVMENFFERVQKRNNLETKEAIDGIKYAWRTEK